MHSAGSEGVGCSVGDSQLSEGPVCWVQDGTAGQLGSCFGFFGSCDSVPQSVAVHLS